MSPRLAIVLGTRPEMIKLAPIIRAMRDRVLVVHTGQHFDANMSGFFLDQLHIGQPDLLLEVGGATRGSQIGQSLIAIEQFLITEKPAAVLVQGDTNSALAGGLAANAASIPLAHLEAGLRSYDRTMPEEHNRILLDAVSDMCLAPHRSNYDILRQEGISESRIRVTGSTLRTALEDLLPDLAERDNLLRQHQIERNQFVLATVHRVENADSEANLRSILTELASLSVPVILPLHPRTRKRAAEFGLTDLLDQLHVTDPLGYREFISLAADCALIISDSGGVQEEATIVKRPVIVVRSSTERPEIVGTFAHLMPVGSPIGQKAQEILNNRSAVHQHLSSLPYPYGQDATEQCVAALDELMNV